MKIETDIITSIRPSLIGGAVIFVVMLVETLKSNVIVFIGKRHSVFDVTLTDYCQFVDV